MGRTPPPAFTDSQLDALEKQKFGEHDALVRRLVKTARARQRMVLVIHPTGDVELYSEKPVDCHLFHAPDLSRAYHAARYIFRYLPKQWLSLVTPKNLRLRGKRERCMGAHELELVHARTLEAKGLL